MKNYLLKSHSGGFTLIELLIVVAIIGILAAIAVPNFMNARLKANVARCYSDTRALAQAFDMYNLDNNAYPYFGETLWYTNIIYPKLTSPVAYIATIPLDPFTIRDTPQRAEAHGHYYPAWNIDAMLKYGWTWGGPGVKEANERGSIMLIVSSGPDKHEDIASQFTVLAYHVSNGLVSEGDIYRFTPGTQADSF